MRNTAVRTVPTADRKLIVSGSSMGSGAGPTAVAVKVASCPPARTDTDAGPSVCGSTHRARAIPSASVSDSVGSTTPPVAPGSQRTRTPGARLPSGDATSTTSESARALPASPVWPSPANTLSPGGKTTMAALARASGSAFAVAVMMALPVRRARTSPV